MDEPSTASRFAKHAGTNLPHRKRGRTLRCRSTNSATPGYATGFSAQRRSRMGRSTLAELTAAAGLLIDTGLEAVFLALP
jgi:hypothetical protein